MFLAVVSRMYNFRVRARTLKVTQRTEQGQKLWEQRNGKAQNVTHRPGVVEITEACFKG